MDGMLSQDEINALLTGMDVSEELAESIGEDDGYAVGADQTSEEEILTDVDRDAIGEVANISMGSSATTLYSLVNRKVNITTPVVDLAKWETLLGEYERPCVFIQIKYTQGLDGTNILVLKEQDVKIITDLMMGGDGTNTDGELGELHLSAISEAMNQMMGSAATSLSSMLKTTIDLTKYSSGGDVAPFLGGDFVKIAFRMQIGDLVDSTIMQLYPIEFAKKVVDNFMNNQMFASEESASSAPAPVVENTAPVGQPDMNYAGSMAQPEMNQMGMDPMMNQMGMNPMMNQMAMNPMMNPMAMNPMMNQMAMNPMMGMAPMGGMPQQNINVQPAQFQNFATDMASVAGQENIGLIKDVPLEVTVELGRTTKSISEILDFAPGTIIELDRIAGEPIDVLVNGKFVARGEVVVIEESFGIRVTEIIK